MVEGSLESLHAKTVNFQYLCKYQINIKTRQYIKYFLDKSPWAPTRTRTRSKINENTQKYTQRIYFSILFIIEQL